MKNFARVLLVIVVTAVGGFFISTKLRTDSLVPVDGRIRVAASFYPLAEFARQVGEDRVHVTTVVPADSEPHDYEPTPEELARVYTAAVFLYNGSGIDPWAERVAAEVERSGVHTINMSAQLPLLSAPAGEDRGQAQRFDPHTWLDPVLAQTQVTVIRDALIAVDPEHAPAYRSRAAAYHKRLQQLDEDFRSGLQLCARRDLVTSHAAFGYLAKRYDLSVLNIAGLSAEEEPSARRVSELARAAREKQIRYIFFETLVSPKLAQTLASEIGATTLVLNPLEGLSDEEQRSGKDYLSIMRDNLRHLRVALECQ